MSAPLPHFAIIAHRGDSDAAPENTLAAFDLALQQGFPAFETDVQLSADRAAVIIHCEELERTTNGTGRVADASLEAILQLDAGGWFGARFAGARRVSMSGWAKASLTPYPPLCVGTHNPPKKHTHPPATPYRRRRGAGAHPVRPAAAVQGARAHPPGGRRVLQRRWLQLTSTALQLD
jgi:hypothetical protein